MDGISFFAYYGKFCRVSRDKKELNNSKKIRDINRERNLNLEYARKGDKIMKQVRKGILGLLLAGCASIALVGCGNEEDGVNNTAADKTTESIASRDAGAAARNAAADADAANGAGETERTARADSVSTNQEDTVHKTDAADPDADNENVNSVTSGRDDNADGEADVDERAAGNGSDGALEEIGAGVGEVGDGIINGAADIVNDVTGNNGADNTAR